VFQGLGIAVAGAALAFAMSTFHWLGGTTSALYLLPWLAVLGGMWRGAAGLLSR
jgi:hypothetical protein